MKGYQEWHNELIKMINEYGFYVYDYQELVSELENLIKENEQWLIYQSQKRKELKQLLKTYYNERVLVSLDSRGRVVIQNDINFVTDTNKSLEYFDERLRGIDQCLVSDRHILVYLVQEINDIIVQILEENTVNKDLQDTLKESIKWLNRINPLEQDYKKIQDSITLFLKRIEQDREAKEGVRTKIPEVLKKDVSEVFIGGLKSLTSYKKEGEGEEKTTSLLEKLELVKEELKRISQIESGCNSDIVAFDLLYPFLEIPEIKVRVKEKLANSTTNPLSLTIGQLVNFLLFSESQNQ